MGLREMVKGDVFLGTKKLIVEGDNLIVIQSIKKLWKISWIINSLIADIYAWRSKVIWGHLKLFQEVKSLHVRIERATKLRIGWSLGSLFCFSLLLVRVPKPFFLCNHPLHDRREYYNSRVGQGGRYVTNTLGQC